MPFTAFFNSICLIMTPAVSMLLSAHVHCCMTSLAMQDVCFPIILASLTAPTVSLAGFCFPNIHLALLPYPSFSHLLSLACQKKIWVCLHSNYVLLLMCICYSECHHDDWVANSVPPWRLYHSHPSIIVQTIGSTINITFNFNKALSLHRDIVHVHR